jgi:hypothetical protein
MANVQSLCCRLVMATWFVARKKYILRAIQSPLSLLSLHVQEIGIVPYVIVAFEPQEFTPAGMGTGQAQSEHSRFTALVGEAHDFGGWHHAAKAFCSLHFRGGREGEVGAFRHRRGDCNMGLPNSLPNFELILMGVQGYSSNQVSGMGVLGLDGTSLSFKVVLLPWGLSQPQIFERRVRVSTANVGDDRQFQYFHACEVNLIVLNFACRLRGTEIPLLPHDFAKAWISF